ncbi:hypothetical protein BD769DRAFT_1396185 [Suillus cothurnatus]|nr:hypothetical protein BD769DRAFT_1396185 [Suillus cothurnatus]
MKIPCPHTHAINDYTKALFHMNKCERELDAHAAVDEVWKILFDNRTSAIMQLHNNISVIDMQSVISDQPTGKVDFPTKWESMPVSVKMSTNELFKEMKKYIGRGKIDMAPSAQTKQGMPAIVMELHLAKQYCIEECSLGILKGWTYWDGVDVPKPTVEQEATNNEEMLRIQHNMNVCIAAEKADRDTILKVVKQIMSLKIAHATCHKSSEILSDIAEAMNALIQLCDLSNNDMAGFNLHKHYIDLGIPKITGDKDLQHQVKRTMGIKMSVTTGMDEDENDACTAVKSKGMVSGLVHLDTAPDVAMALHEGINEMALKETSPLSSPTSPTASNNDNEQSDDEQMPCPVNLVMDVNLVAELNAFDGKHCSALGILQYLPQSLV